MTLEMEILPIFSSPLAVINIEEKLFCLEDFLSLKYNFFSSNTSASSGTHAYTDVNDWNILKNFPYQQGMIMRYFNTYKNQVLQLHSTNFCMTTSWITKVDVGGFSQFHNHKNSMYSAVYYFDDVSGGNIEFDSMGVIPAQILLNRPTEWNIYNSQTWTYYPKKDTMIIFPSYLYHRVTENNSNSERYSLAINFFPDGGIGEESDSYINIGHI
jgi:uncharacterized protein (TIGR02466 family)